MSPKLRFKDFNSAWKIARLEDELLKYKLGGNYANSETVTKHPLIKMGNLGRGEMNLRKLEHIEKGEVIDPEDEIKDGDLFFNTRNTLELVGKVAIWRSELPRAYYNSNLMRLTFACNHFMNYRFNSSDGIEALRRLATGTTSVAAIYTRDLLQMEINIPTLPEQRKIADFLTAVDGRLAQLSQKKVLLEEYKKGVMQQLFTQALRFQDDHGNDFLDWEEKKLGEITKWSSGGTPAKDVDSYWSGDIPWMSAASMHGRFYDDSPLRISELGLLNGSRLAKKGALLLLVRGSMLWNRVPVGIATKDVAFNQDVKALVPTSEVVSEFLLQWFIASENMLLQMVVGTGIGAGKLDTDQMKDTEVLLPSKAEQTKIANFLSAIDLKIATVAKQIAHTQTWKKGLLQQMFV